MVTRYRSPCRRTTARKNGHQKSKGKTSSEPPTNLARANSPPVAPAWSFKCCKPPAPGMCFASPLEALPLDSPTDQSDTTTLYQRNHCWWVWCVYSKKTVSDTRYYSMKWSEKSFLTIKLGGHTGLQLSIQAKG